MPIDKKAYLQLLARSKPMSRILSDQEIEALEKGFEKTRGAEPTNTGVAKEVGMMMIEAAAEDAERRTQETKK
jgi:hypothetical protein